jgi:hypothetical protein
LSIVFAGQNVGIREVAEKIWLAGSTPNRAPRRSCRPLAFSGATVIGLFRSHGSGASAVTRNDRILVSAIDNLKRVPVPIEPSTIARGAVGRRQMTIDVS